MGCLAQTVTGVLDALLPYSSASLIRPVSAIKICGSEGLISEIMKAAPKSIATVLTKEITAGLWFLI
jgi:hypothetical protein